MNKSKVIGFWIFCMAVFYYSSILFSGIWGDKPEKSEAPAITDIHYTLSELAVKNNIELKALQEVLKIPAGSASKKLSELGISDTDAQILIEKAIALDTEHKSKNWQKIVAKFLLWGVFLGFMFYTMTTKKKISKRSLLYFVSAFLFGAVFGSDPGPMGTIKDALVLFLTKHAIFKPRIMAFCIFTATIILANKFICSWGCQAGVLQDFFFRIAHPKKDGMPVFKPPFVLSNTVRILFLAAICIGAALYGTDIVEPIDIFKIFNPLKLSVYGLAFVLGILFLSMFLYRPWCHFLCPFGFTGWLCEKISVYKISVDYSKCIACGACEKACPSTVMGAILKQDRVIPDCFSCNVCVETCPKQAIQFSKDTRHSPPEGFFNKEQKTEE